MEKIEVKVEKRDTFTRVPVPKTNPHQETSDILKHIPLLKTGIYRSFNHFKVHSKAIKVD